MRSKTSGRRLLALAFVLSTAVDGQWLNYHESGVPRTANGKADLTAPAPKDASGKPDISGVWMHETTTVAEMRRPYGSVIDEAIKVDAPGMEIGTYVLAARGWAGGADAAPAAINIRIAHHPEVCQGLTSPAANGLFPASPVPFEVATE